MLIVLLTYCALLFVAMCLLRRCFLQSRVDPEFREVCLQDAKHICKSDQVAEPRLDTEVGVDSFHLPFNLVMSCLYRNIKSTAGNVGLLFE